MTGVDVMADDRDARIAQLEAENAALREREAEFDAASHRLREQQAATADILRMIATSQVDLSRVLGGLAGRAYRLCGASSARVYLVDGDVLRIVASSARSPDGDRRDPESD